MGTITTTVLLTKAVKTTALAPALGPFAVPIAIGAVCVGAAILVHAASNSRNSRPRGSGGGGSTGGSRGSSNTSTTNSRTRQRSRERSTGAPRRRRSKSVDDPRSSETEDGQTSVATHLVNRLERFFRLGGLIERIAEAVDIPRDLIVVDGASQFQDESSGMGDRGIHAAHLVRGIIHAELEHRSRRLFNELRNFMGHTQNVPRYVNDWWNLGGDIDRFFGRLLDDLSDIIFSTRIDDTARKQIKRIRNMYIELLRDYDRRNPTDDVKVAIERLENTSVEELFDEGHAGYTGEDMEPYQDD